MIRAVSNEKDSVAIAEDETLGAWKLAAGLDPAGRPPSLLFCDNETNAKQLFGVASETPYPKDGVNDHVVHGAATVNPERRGTKMACWYRVAVGAEETVELRLRLARDTPGRAIGLGEDFAQTHADRSREADEYYAALRPEGASDAEARIQAVVGASREIGASRLGRLHPPPRKDGSWRSSRLRPPTAFCPTGFVRRA